MGHIIKQKLDNYIQFVITLYVKGSEAVGPGRGRKEEWDRIEHGAMAADDDGGVRIITRSRRDRDL